MINGLRQDPNECVRFAAARALNSGCCCDKKVIDALRICVSGESSDGAPAENSFRVKAAAFSALQNCLMRVPEDLPPETPPPAPEGGPTQLTPLPPAPERSTRRLKANPNVAATSYNPARRGPITYDEQLRQKTFSQTVDQARRTLFQVAQAPRPPVMVPSGQRSLFGALSRARNEVSAVNVRRAREQGVVPPQADPSRAPTSPEPAQSPSGAGVEPGTFSPAAGTDAGSMPAARPGFVPAAVGTESAHEGAQDPGPVSNAEPTPTPTSAARRGLIGLLLQPRGN